MTQEEIMKLVTSKEGFIGHAMNIPHDRQNKTHELVLEYNQTSPADIKRGQDLLKQILGTYNEKVESSMAFTSTLDSTPISLAWPM